MTFPGGAVFKTTSAAPVLGLIAIPTPNEVEETQTKHVKWPVASEKPGLLKSYFEISLYHSSILNLMSVIGSVPYPSK
jgi:hypothetical protein